MCQPRRWRPERTCQRRGRRVGAVSKPYSNHGAGRCRGMVGEPSDGTLEHRSALRLHWLWLLAIAVAFVGAATALVLAALPNRVNMMAERTDEDAFIPLRQLSVAEAA